MNPLVSSLLLWLATIGLAACSKQGPAEAPAPLPAQTQAEQRNHGRYLAAVGGCMSCHTQRGGPDYAGGREIPTPFGRFHVPNITPDMEHGIGSWSADDFWRAMHEGLSKDGSFLYPAFPYTNYTRVTREDSDAIHAYLMSITPVSRKRRAHDMNFPYSQRTLLAGWRALYFTPGERKDDPKQSKEWNRGAYLVEGLGHCNACHATRNVLGAVTRDDDVSGGLIPLQNWYAPSLTSSQETGLGGWQTSDIVDLLRTGVSARGAVFGPMAAVVQHNLQALSTADLTAIAVYLKAQGETKSSEPALEPAAPASADAAGLVGAKIYTDRCEPCHGADGQGVPRIYPPLAGNPSITMKNAINPIRIVLNGGFPPSTEGNPRPYGMPPFYQELNDGQVAAVVTYIRQSWGNRAPPTSALEVQKSRGVPVD